MLAKIGFVIGAIALATFTMDRVESLVAHRDFAGSIAWAEDWDSSADDADTEADSQPAAVPDISGVYSGTVNDHLSGSGSADATISQTNNSLTGTFNTFFNSGTLKGKVQANSKVHMRLTVGGGCGANFKGTFKNGNEITGNYHVTGCKKGNGDRGTLDIFR